MVDIGSSTDYREDATTASGLARLGPGAVGTYLHPLDERTADAVAMLWRSLTAARGHATGPTSLELGAYG